MTGTTGTSHPPISSGSETSCAGAAVGRVWGRQGLPPFLFPGSGMLFFLMHPAALFLIPEEFPDSTYHTLQKTLDDFPGASLALI